VNDLDSVFRLLPVIIPLFLIEIALMVVALVDVVKRERVRGGNKVVWILVIVLISMIGPMVYLLFGREEAPLDSDQD
jgi:hypothetical protein